ncbi:SarA family transcriptional regulator [Staphylococcus xylosus]|uniref:MarR family transcriptional regulator n=4 Tax=Staphylococcus TaxID=1279 RepID=A0A5R9B2G5_STAXY|nr:SarA family transcriptional regulator [Staphylococcus xylosus]AID42110.1 Transcriptional regulator SarV [Staphylococcus xylosus]MBE6178987.1 MarR family transcriptional regulator [Staphylococcus xylosus]MCA2499688.1 SarA family transcriptional regulator [Staphylococcus xylosus]MCA2502974.1 SarA family transcriptional regulator [Staphylococcus xylosus]MCE4995319.1 SarA family transcriptional regulator [Staphylococcus xylosus]
MDSKVSYFITSERDLCQLKHWLKSKHKMSIEEFVVLFKVYEATRISGKELRDALHFEMLWDTSKIDVIIRKIYKKELISKVRSETDERQVFYYYNNDQKQLLDDIIKEVEQINVAQPTK